MYKRYYRILKNQFSIRNQGYTLVKTMFFMYALKKCEINFKGYTNIIGIQDKLSYIKNCAQRNSNIISNTIGEPGGSLIKDCICSFDDNVITGSGMTECLEIVDNMNLYEIKDFIIYEANEVGEREDFSTPDSLIDLMLNLLDNGTVESVYDQGSNNGNTLVKAKLKFDNVTLQGDEIKNDCVLLTKLRLYFCGASKYCINQNNVVASPSYYNADIGMATIPFNVRCRNEIARYNSNNKYITDLKGFQTLDWIFVDRLLQVVNQRGIVVMPEGRLSNDIDAVQRKDLLDANLVEGVIKLPSNLFAYTNISVSLLILNKNKANKEVRFLDATLMCKKGHRFSTLNVDEIVMAYNSDAIVTKVDINDIINCDYDLNVNKYLNVMDIKLEEEAILSEVVDDLFRGAQIPSSMIEEYAVTNANDKICKLLSVGDIQNSTFDINSLQIIRNDGKFDRYIVRNGDVLISCKSSKIKTAVVDISSNDCIIATGSLLVVRCNEQRINPVYLKTFFDSDNGMKLLESIQTGTTIISINARALLGMRISCVDRVRQEKIANQYLTKLDQLKIARLKVKKLENEINNIFDDNIGG